MFLKKKLFLRNFRIKNIFTFSWTNLGKLSFSITNVKESVHSNKILAFYSLIYLIFSKKPYFIRLKKSFPLLKLRKGHIIGVKITFRRLQYHYLLKYLNYFIIPHLRDKTPKAVSNFNAVQRSSSILISDFFLMAFLKPYYNFFSTIKSPLHVHVVTFVSNPAKNFFLLRLFEWPF